MGAKHRIIVENQADELELTRSQFAVLAAIAFQIRKDETVSYPGVANLCKKTRYCARTVQNALRDLERGGILLTRWRAGGRGIRTVYAIPGICDGYIIPQPPIIAQAPVEYVPREQRPLAEQLRFCRAIYVKLRNNNPTSPRLEYWAGEIATLERQAQAEEKESQAGHADQDTPTVVASSPDEQAEESQAANDPELEACQRLVATRAATLRATPEGHKKYDQRLFLYNTAISRLEELLSSRERNPATWPIAPPATPLPILTT